MPPAIEGIDDEPLTAPRDDSQIGVVRDRARTGGLTHDPSASSGRSYGSTDPRSTGVRCEHTFSLRATSGCTRRRRPRDTARLSYTAADGRLPRSCLLSSWIALVSAALSWGSPSATPSGPPS